MATLAIQPGLANKYISRQDANTSWKKLFKRVLLQMTLQTIQKMAKKQKQIEQKY